MVWHLQIKEVKREQFLKAFPDAPGHNENNIYYTTDKGIGCIKNYITDSCEIFGVIDKDVSDKDDLEFLFALTARGTDEKKNRLKRQSRIMTQSDVNVTSMKVGDDIEIIDKYETKPEGKNYSWVYKTIIGIFLGLILLGVIGVISYIIFMKKLGR